MNKIAILFSFFILICCTGYSISYKINGINENKVLSLSSSPSPSSSSSSSQILEKGKEEIKKIKKTNKNKLLYNVAIVDLEPKLEIEQELLTRNNKKKMEMKEEMDIAMMMMKAADRTDQVSTSSSSSSFSEENKKSSSDDSAPAIQSNLTFSGYMTGGEQVCDPKSCNSPSVFTQNYLCNTSSAWANGYVFHDPVPPTGLFVVHKIVVTFTGMFNVIPPTSMVFSLVNGEENAGIFFISKSSPSQCPNCQISFSPRTLPDVDPNGLASYRYGSNNSIIFNLFETDVACIGKVTANIFYGPVAFKVNSVVPNTAPSTGGETVYFIGEQFYQSSQIQCKFGTVISTGTYINSTCASCVVPPMLQSNSTTPSDYNVTIQLSEDGGSSFCLNTTFFIYTAASIPFVKPTSPNYQKIIYIVVGVGIAVLLIIAVGIYFIIRLRIKNKRLNGSKHALPIGINDDERSPLLKTDYKTLFEIKPIDISEIVVQNRIGRGSCAEVFTGTWRGIIVAIKKAKLLNEDDEDFLNELAQEATIMSQLRHPNICQFLGTCNNPPEILIVMEYMPLGSLYRILHDPSISLDWPRMKSMALDIAKGMNYLHCCDPIVIHRDLKSHNLLVDEHYRVKISDFGLSTRFKKHLDKKTAMTPVGTPCWTAPEVLRNDPYTEKADVFSFAIVLWEIVTREDPYQGMPTFQIVISVGQHKLRPIVPPQVSAPFTRLITECWSEDPQQRPSFQEIVKRLEAM
ncbi:hypothetical protein ACTFIT_011636 [Dictyostelium discoideum]